MTATIDKRVVEMAFENQQFEKGVATTLTSVDKLKKNLNFSDAEKSFSGLTAAAGRVNLGAVSDGLSKLTGGFSALGIIGATALFNLTNAAINAGQKIANALVIEPIKTGLTEYETKLNSVQTILANTQKEGTTLSVVTDALNKLNEYSDKTIYNFQEMTRNIGTFTAAGVSLDSSVAAIKGIANLAAVSGSNSQQASTAMYQLSQALSSGTVRLMDWNSVVNAGMGGQVFQDAILETARVHGVAVDTIIKEEGSFRDSLQRGWLSSEIMTETLQKFTGDLSREQLQTMGYTEEQIAGIIKLGQTANDAATKVKTFTQLFSTLKEAAQSGWAQTWELIIGDFEEAKSFLTDLNNWFGSIIGASADARNNLLKGWKDMGGRTKLLESFQNVLNGIVSVLNPIREAMKEIFPPITVETLVKLTNGLANLTKSFILSEKAAGQLKRLFKGIFGILDIGRMAVVAIGKEFARLVTKIAPATSGFGEILGKLGDFLLMLRDGIKVNDVFGKIMRTIGDTILLVAGIIGKGVTAFSDAIEKFTKLKSTEGFFKAFLATITSFFTSFKSLDFGIIGDFIDKLKERFAPLAGFAEFLENAFGGVKTATSPFAEKLKEIRENIAKALREFALDVLDQLSKIDFTKINFNKAFDSINAGLLGALLLSITQFVRKGTGMFGSIVDIFKSVSGFAQNANGILAGITTVMTGVKDILSAWQQQIRAGILLKIAGAIAILAISLIALSMVDSQKLTTALAAVTALFANLFGALAIYEKVSGGASGIPAMAKSIGALIAMSVAVLILSGALVNLSKIPTDELIKGILAITTLTGVLIGTSMALSKNSAGVIKGAGSMIIFGIALRTMLGPVKELGDMDLDQLAKGLGGLGLLLLEIGVFMKGMNFKGTAIDDMLAIFILGAAVSDLSQVVTQFAQMDSNALVQGLSVMGIILAQLMAFTKLSSGGVNFIATAAGMVILSVAMQILADVLQKIGQLSWDELGVALAGLGGSLLILGIALNAMSGGIAGAATLLVAAAAIAILVPALKALGSMSLEQVGIALLAIAGVFTVLGLAGLILTPVVPVIILLAVAIGLLGVAALAAGVGILAFGTGLAALAAIGAAGAGAIAAVLVALATVLPLLAIGAAKSIVAFAKTLKDGAPVIFDAAGALMLGFIGAIAETIPAAVLLVLDFITKLLQGVAEKLPDIVQAGYDILLGFLSGVRDNIGEVVTVSYDIVTEYLNAVASRLPELVDSGWKLIIAWVDGMKAGVEENLPVLMDSVRELGLAIIKGLLTGLLEGQEDVRNGIMEIAQILIDDFKEKLGIASPSTVFTTFGLDIIMGLVNGIRENIGQAVGAMLELGQRVIDSMKGKYDSMKSAGEDLVTGFAAGIKSQIETAVKTAAQLAAAVLGKIREVLDSHSPSRETMLIGKDLDEGMAIGIAKFTGMVVTAAKDMTDSTLSTVAGLSEKLATVLSAEDNFNPTITPVLDLTAIENGSGQIQSLLSAKPLNLAFAANTVAGISTQSQSGNISSTDQNNVPNGQPVVNYTQNNYSPKELSRIDIYRQTKNLLLQTKGV